jgi:hypothetical protein
MRIIVSPRAGKKYRAEFDDGTHTDFGATGYKDFTIFSKGDKEEAERRKEQYLRRHRSRENWNDYKSPGALSRFVLWNKASLRDSIADYKRRFNL